MDRVTPILATRRGQRISTGTIAGAVGEGATPCTDGRPPENTPAWIASHQSSLPDAAKGHPPREPRERDTEGTGARTLALTVFSLPATRSLYSWLLQEVTPSCFSRVARVAPREAADDCTPGLCYATSVTPPAARAAGSTAVYLRHVGCWSETLPVRPGATPSHGRCGCRRAFTASLGL